MVFASVIEDKVTLWWDPAEDKQDMYRVEDGGKVYETGKTHVTYTGTSGKAHVYAGGKELGSIALCPGKKPDRIDVRDYGALGDGSTLNTLALQKAIDACAGGEVYVPSGTYLTGALRLHSDMSVYLEKGAVLQGTDNPDDYLPKIPSRFEGTECECYQSLLNLGSIDHAGGPNARNVVIHGQGTISGGGQSLALHIIDREKERLADYMASLGEELKTYENEHTIPGRARGRLINLSNCENVRITGLTLQNGASWNVHMIYSRQIVTDHCVFRSEGVWNGDGWDPDSSEDCTLFASEFHTGDDSVAIKSGKNPEGNVIARPTRRIRVFDCVSEYGLGVAIGSEMSGGVENVRIWDCDLEHSLYGVQIKGTRKRGGYIRDVQVRDSVLPRFVVCAPSYNDDGEGSPVPPKFSDMHCERVRFTGWCRNYWEKEEHDMPCIDIAGFDVPGYEAENMTFTDCEMPENAQLHLEHARKIRIGTC